MRLIIVGGVAGGATAATRARRLSEDADIVLFERGFYVSYANCGLPYYIGGEIEKRDDLFIASPERLRDRYRIDVRTSQEVISIDRQEREVVIKDHGSGVEFKEGYDKLILYPGAAPTKPPLPGIDSSTENTAFLDVRTWEEVNQTGTIRVMKPQPKWRRLADTGGSRSYSPPRMST